MGSHAVALSFVLALRVSALASANTLQPHMPNVCAEQELAIVGQRQPCVQALTRTVKVWKQDCAGRRWCTGYEQRTVYYTGYRQAYKVGFQTTYRCCPGWAQLGGDAGCLYPVCSDGVCFNGGKCMEGSSQLCHCPAGFQGPRCQYDVNECEVGNGGCESQCRNTIGSFYCKCTAGLRLEQDGRTCAGRAGAASCSQGSDFPSVVSPSSVFNLLLPNQSGREDATLCL